MRTHILILMGDSVYYIPIAGRTFKLTPLAGGGTAFEVYKYISKDSTDTFREYSLPLSSDYSRKIEEILNELTK